MTSNPFAIFGTLAVHLREWVDLCARKLDCIFEHRGPFILSWREIPTPKGNAHKLKVWRCVHCEKRNQ